MTIVQQNTERINNASQEDTSHDQPNPLTFIQRADACIERGWVPIPTCWPTPEGSCGCGSGHTGHNIGKAPLVKWAGLTLRDAKNEYHGWAKRWPWANVSILAEASGLIFVGPDSEEARHDWQARGLPLSTIRGSHNSGYLYKRPVGCALARSCKPEYGDIMSAGLVVVAGTHALGDEIYITDDEPTEAPDWVVALLASSEAEPIERPVTEGSGAEPPVRLYTDEAKGLWYGSLVVNKAGDIVPAERADIDRSSTLFRIGAALADARATRSTIADALAERDETLGYCKFSDRKDDGENEYLRIAEKTVSPREAVYSSSARATSRVNGRAHAAGATEAQSNEETIEQQPDEDPLEEARGVLLNLHERIKTEPAEALRNALETPETLGALALVANRDRGTYEATLLRLRESGAKDREVRALDKAVTAERRKRTKTLRAVGPGEEPELAQVVAILPDAPAPDALVVPVGYRLGEHGLARESTSTDEEGTERTSLIQIAPAPIIIAGRLKDVSDDTESTRLAWKRDGHWQNFTAPRAQVASSRSIVDLAGVGLPVTSGTANEIVPYLAAFESANLAHLPVANVAGAMGWQGHGGKLGYLWGRTLIRSNGERSTIDIDSADPSQWAKGLIAFRGQDAGDEQIADAFYSDGTFDGWRQAVKPVGQFPRVALVLYGAIAPAILSVLDAPNFNIDLAYPTSTGKTTSLRVAGSVWGNPDERSTATTVNTWDATRVWIERASSILNGLPLILDDTKRAKKSSQIAQVVYDVSQGRGRGRGSPRGMRRAGSWCTVLISTGEAPLTSFTQDGGTRARVLSLWGAPFGKTDAKTAKIVLDLSLGIRQNFGHAGPAFVEFVMKHRANWDDWRDEYRRLQGFYQEKAGSNPVAGRYAAYFAVLDMTAALAHAALDLPWNYRDPTEALWTDLIEGASEADRASAALDYLRSWAQGHAGEFWGRHPVDRDGNARQPNAGWAGKWDHGDEWPYLAFLPHRLRAILTEAGFDPDPIMRTWKDRGWQIMDKDGQHQLRIRVAGELSRVVAIKRESFTGEPVGGNDEQAEDEED